MAQNNYTSSTQSEAYDDYTTGNQSIIHANMLDIQPLVPAEIMGLEQQDNGLFYYNVKPLLYDIDTQGQPQENVTIYNVPAAFCGNSNAFIDNLYRKGDKVSLIICSRDIGNIKNSWKQGTPAGDSLFLLNGAIIHGLLINSKPKNYISITEDDKIAINFIKEILLNVENGDLKQNAQNLLIKLIKDCTIKAGNNMNLEAAAINAKANMVKLGLNALYGVLLENTILTIDDANVTIDGTAHKFAGTIVFSGGSSSVWGAK